MQEKQLEGCHRQLEVVQFEADYIKDQLTTTEVRGGRVPSPLPSKKRAHVRTHVRTHHHHHHRTTCSHNICNLAQVSMARVYNWDVQIKRSGAGSSSDAAAGS